MLPASVELEAAELADAAREAKKVMMSIVGLGSADWLGAMLALVFGNRPWMSNVGLGKWGWLGEMLPHVSENIPWVWIFDSGAGAPDSARPSNATLGLARALSDCLLALV
jgi:hypothetical protein